MSADAPQSGETEKIKKEFLKDWEDVMSRVPRTEKIVVVFFKECMAEMDMAKGTEKGRNSWKARRA